MANNIEKVDLIQKMLDKAMVQGAVTGFMEQTPVPLSTTAAMKSKFRPLRWMGSRTTIDSSASRRAT